MDVFTPAPTFPYLPTLLRLALALALGLFVGLERERRGKEAGLRTFGFAALLGGLGGLLGDAYALLDLGLLGILVVFLNWATLRAGEGPGADHLGRPAGDGLHRRARRPGPHLHACDRGHRDRGAAGLE